MTLNRLIFGFFPVNNSWLVVNRQFSLIVLIGITEKMSVAAFSAKWVHVSSTLACTINVFLMWHIDCQILSSRTFISKCFGAASVILMFCFVQKSKKALDINTDPKSA